MCVQSQGFQLLHFLILFFLPLFAFSSFVFLHLYFFNFNIIIKIIFCQLVYFNFSISSSVNPVASITSCISIPLANNFFAISFCFFFSPSFIPFFYSVLSFRSFIPFFHSFSFSRFHSCIVIHNGSLS